MENPQFKIIIIILPLISFFFLLSSCEHEKPIPEDKLIKIYVDLLIMQDTIAANPVPLDSMKAIVFSKHNITSDQYEKTIAEYNSSPERWGKFFDKAIEEVEGLKKKSSEK